MTEPVGTETRRAAAPPPAPARHAPPAPDGGAPGARRRLHPRTRRRLGWAAAVAVLLLLIGYALSPTPLEVETAPAERGPLEVTVDAEGVTRLRERFQVSAPVAGRLERMALREGDAVEVGAVIARITPAPLDPQAAAQARARLSAAQAALREAEARLQQARAASEQAERTAARLREVAAAGGLSAEALERAELERATTLREQQAAESRLRAAAAEVEAARAGLIALAPARAEAVSVRAPAAGRVLRVYEPSERVVAAGTPLVEVGGAAGLEVVVDVLSSDAVRIPAGAPVRLLEWGGEGELAARVRLVEPSGFTKISALGVEEQRVNVIVDPLAAPAALGDGYRVEARIVVWQADDVLKVPTSALFRAGDAWTVFVVEDGRARLRPVRVGRRGATEAEVVAGLEAGEAVVVFPSDRVADGARVRTR